MDAEQDAIGRIRLLPAAVDIALARDRVDEADQYCSELEEGAEKFDSPGFRAWALHARGAVLVKQGPEKPKRCPSCTTRCAGTGTRSAATRWHRCRVDGAGPPGVRRQ